MPERILPSGVVARTNLALLGGVSVGMDRLGVPNDEYGLDELQASTTDWYGSGGRVSIETEADRTLDIQARLDQQVVDENLYHEPTLQRGLPPCKRVGLDD